MEYFQFAYGSTQLKSSWVEQWTWAAMSYFAAKRSCEPDPLALETRKFLAGTAVSSTKTRLARLGLSQPCLSSWIASASVVSAET